MSLIAIGEIPWPELLAGPSAASTGLAVANITFDSATDRVAWLGRSSFTGSIASIDFRTFTVTTGNTMEIRIETVTNGRPSGTLWATNTNGTVVVADSDDNAWKTVTLTAAASLTPGQEFAIVVVSSSGTPNMILAGRNAGVAQYAQLGQYPLVLQDTGAGTWAQLSNTWPVWIVNLTTTGPTFVRGLSPSAATATTTAYNSGASPDEYALKFTAPVAMRCSGIMAYLANITAGADFTISLWPASSDDDTDALAQTSEDGDATYAATVDGYVAVYWATPVTLTSGTIYYLGVRADTANSLAFACLVAKDAAAMPAFNISGTMFLATRTWTAGTAGAWTETATSTLPIASLIIDAVDVTGGAVDEIKISALPGGTPALTSIFPGVTAGTTEQYTFQQAATVLSPAWTTPPFSAGDFTANGAMTWTVAAGDVTGYAYQIEGKRMTVSWNLNDTTVGGTLNTELLIAIPGGKVSTKSMQNTVYISDNGTENFGLAIVDVSGTTIRISKIPVANWSASTDATRTRGQITFEIN